MGAGLVHWDEQGTIWHNATCTLMSNGLWTVQRSLTTVIKTINYIKPYKKHKKTKAAFPHSPKLHRAHSCGHGQSEGSFILLALTM